MNTRLRWALVVGAVIFAWFVWPTRYDRYTYQGMTVLRDRWRGCEKILTPAGPRSIGGDARCFLPGEDKTPSVIHVLADAELTAPDHVTQIVDDVMQGAGFINDTSSRQRQVMDGLDVTVTLDRPLPVLRVINHSSCMVEWFSLRILSRGEELKPVRVDIGHLEPGQERQTDLPVRIFPTDPQITLENVTFHDGDWDLQNSFCATP
ncbi:hypothetical protein [Deinococcus sedimenti]|uniref:Uncharacterized protein n=1 Tax=Deinococcus sedimenti TaxID=1867090 RepID=A0ABQ2S6M1_9DEIO|nr:hypothetical protein [Deinococcus sedimenti]GGS02650.1 hypothetical protein GCM10008960_31570 [Deinococcus sedimenti]